MNPLPILSEGEVYFLKTILPILLALPWAIAILFLLIRFLLRWLSSLKPKGLPEEFNKRSIPHVQETPYQWKTLKLKEIKELAQTNPRLAIMELSSHIRKVKHQGKHENLSLEHFILLPKKKKSHRFTDIRLEKKSLTGDLNLLYVDIVLHSYQREEPSVALAEELISRYSGFKQGGKKT
ncbi:hypothetical protein [Leptospira ryugenii]|uniref:hypothetical protein n=1 Tax=Leptospira ryugenii TaxID=1917863 RepID=UPI00107F24EA|nr:hypothetical protein [Leptospira ryugenii]